MKRNNTALFLEDIKISFEKIFKYTDNLSYDEFINDDKTKDAVERNFEIIGEATKKLPSDIKDKYPNIPFRQIAGMRDKIIHDYFGVDYSILWQTIQNRLPEFYENIKQVINNFNGAV